MLTEAGYEVVANAENGAVAIEMAKLHKPDLAILDVKMPLVDGITAAQEIIEIAPVLMLTAFSQRELVERARDAGVMAYVVISRHKQMKSLQAEVADIYDRLESRKLIEKAKGILMSGLSLSEPQAFSWIQKTAMDRRIPMKEVAMAVIDPKFMPDLGR
jgi:response regulator NasT